MPFQNVADCFIADGITELAKLTLDSVAASVSIFLRELDDETFKVTRDSGSTAAIHGPICPFAFRQLPMPAQVSLWLEESDDMTQLLDVTVAAGSEFRCHHGQCETFNVRIANWLPQNPVLLAQQQYLEILFLRAEPPNPPQLHQR